MRFGIVVNVMDSKEAGATTYRLAAEAINLGYEVWVMSTGNLAYNPDDTIGAFARTVPPGATRRPAFWRRSRATMPSTNGSRWTI